MNQPTAWNELDREYPPEGEDQDIATTIRLVEEIMWLGTGPVHRGQHAKSTGDVKARLIVDPHRPAETRFGIFETNRTFDAIVRFSNGSGSMNPDANRDARGMAIKVLGVEGPRAFEEAGDTDTQDFVMINFPVFPFRNARQYMKFMAWRRFFVGKLGAIGNSIAPLVFFIPWRFDQFAKIGIRLAGNSRSPLVESYFSMSPYRLGQRAIKFKVVPQQINFEDLPSAESAEKHQDDQLSRALTQHLSTREARFDFELQFQQDPREMPIEDTTVVWSESVSKPVKVATLIIDTVDLTSPESTKFRESVENMSFNPWHGLEAHRPLGGINRLRKAVYQASTHARRLSAGRG
jgi:catalase